jgi:uncharacterized protein (TIGR02453 family)
MMVTRRRPAAPLPPEGSTPPRFSEASLRFLRGLARNNRREWFEARRDLYERDLRAPMLALVGEITLALAEFAPEHVRPPEKTLFRIYRDTRFAHDKRPYKTHLAAWWARSGMAKTSGAGYYLHLSGKELQIAAGIYMPTPEQLRTLRLHLLERHEAFRKLLGSRSLARLFTPDPGAPLRRAPKGFPADHPAADLLLPTRWGFSAALPAEAALAPGLVAEVVRRFRAAQPFVDFLNAPITAHLSAQNARKNTSFSTRNARFSG